MASPRVLEELAKLTAEAERLNVQAKEAQAIIAEKKAVPNPEKENLIIANHRRLKEIASQVAVLAKEMPPKSKELNELLKKQKTIADFISENSNRIRENCFSRTIISNHRKNTAKEYKAAKTHAEKIKIFAAEAVAIADYFSPKNKVKSTDEMQKLYDRIKELEKFAEQIRVLNKSHDDVPAIALAMQQIREAHLFLKKQSPQIKTSILQTPDISQHVNKSKTDFSKFERDLRIKSVATEFKHEIPKTPKDVKDVIKKIDKLFKDVNKLKETTESQYEKISEVYGRICKIRDEISSLYSVLNTAAVTFISENYRGVYEHDTATITHLLKQEKEHAKGDAKLMAYALDDAIRGKDNTLDILFDQVDNIKVILQKQQKGYLVNANFENAAYNAFAKLCELKKNYENYENPSKEFKNNIDEILLAYRNLVEIKPPTAEANAVLSFIKLKIIDQLPVLIDKSFADKLKLDQATDENLKIIYALTSQKYVKSEIPEVVPIAVNVAEVKEVEPKAAAQTVQDSTLLTSAPLSSPVNQVVQSVVAVDTPQESRTLESKTSAVQPFPPDAPPLDLTRQQAGARVSISPSLDEDLPESKLKPPSPPQRAYTSGRTGILIDEAKLNKIVDELKKDNWTAEKQNEYKYTIKNTQGHAFEVDKIAGNFSTKSDKLETFVAMLKSFKEAYGDKPPQITTEEKYKEQWVKVLQSEGYTITPEIIKINPAKPAVSPELEAERRPALR